MIDRKKISRLASIPSVTVFEKPMLKYISRYFYAINHDRLVTDRYVAFISKSKRNKVLLTIHIDRLGLVNTGEMITYSNYYGYEKYAKEYKPGIVFGNRFKNRDVRLYDPESGKVLSQGTVIDCQIDSNNKMLFSISGIDWHNKSFPLPIAYMPDIHVVGDKVIGQIDNVLSLYVGYLLLKSQSEFSILFTTEEEIGMSWTYISDFLRKFQYDNIIVLDTTNVEGLIDLNDVDIVFRASDDKADFGKDFVNKLIDVSKKCKVRYYLKTKSKDGSKTKNITEIGRLISQSDLLFQGATVQFPSINYHTVEETATVESIKKVIEYLQALEETYKR